MTYYQFNPHLGCSNGHPLIFPGCDSELSYCPLCVALDKVAELEFQVTALEEKVRILEERP